MFYSIRNLKSKFDTCYSIESDLKFLKWDLIQLEQELFLVKDNKQNWKTIKWNVVYLWNLFEPRTIEFQEFFQKYRFCWYFKVFGLYIKDYWKICKLKLPQIKRAQKNDRNWSYVSEYKNYENFQDYIKMWDQNIKTINYWFFENFKAWEWQNLFIFPDIWSINSFVQTIDFDYTILNSSSTSLSKMRTFLEIKKWKEKNIITTSSGVFQDRKNLQSIFLFDPYKWYYKNQQNPRYYVPDLVKQIAFFYNVPNLYFVMV